MGGFIQQSTVAETTVAHGWTRARLVTVAELDVGSLRTTRKLVLKHSVQGQGGPGISKGLWSVSQMNRLPCYSVYLGGNYFDNNYCRHCGLGMIRRTLPAIWTYCSSRRVLVRDVRKVDSATSKLTNATLLTGAVRPRALVRKLALNSESICTRPAGSKFQRSDPVPCFKVTSPADSTEPLHT